jgi:tRNA(Ile)-lysidine synthase
VQPDRLIEQARIRMLELVPESADLLLAVSGGLDSMVLLHLAVQAAAVEPRRLAVAHLNHGLRAQAGQHDASLVQAAAADCGLQYFAETLPENALKSASVGSLEEAARAARYAFLERTARAQNFCFVAVAHHSNDQAETVLLNIARGTGLAGLRGMPDRRLLSPGVQLVRPLLDFSRAELAAFAADRGISYAEDASNSSSEFTRNRIRHQILPALRESLNPGVDQALVRLARQAGEQLACLDALADQLLEQAILECSESIVRLSRSRLLQSPEPLIRHALIRLWDRQGWPRQRLTAAHWLRTTALLLQNSSVSLPEGLLAESRADLLILRRG